MNDTSILVNRLPNDIGGEQGGALARVEHPLTPWEKRCHALADVLDYHKIISTEAKRRGVEGLGSDVIAKLTYYERWIVAFANILFQMQVLGPSELAMKMDQIRVRMSAECRESQ